MVCICTNTDRTQFIKVMYTLHDSMIEEGPHEGDRSTYGLVVGRPPDTDGRPTRSIPSPQSSSLFQSCSSAFSLSLSLFVIRNVPLFVPDTPGCSTARVPLRGPCHCILIGAPKYVPGVVQRKGSYFAAHGVRCLRWVRGASQRN